MREFDIRKTHYYAAMLFAFFLPLFQMGSTIIMLVWLILSCIRPNIGDKKKLVFWLLPMLFFCYCISVFFSSNQDFEIVVRKLSILVIPIIFLLNDYPQNQKNKIYKWFVYGLVVSSIFCISRGLYNSFDWIDGELLFFANVEEGKGFMESVLYGGNHFFGRYLSYFHQTVYFSMYLCAGLIIIIQKPKMFSRQIMFFMAILFVLMIFLLSNKSGILCFLSILFIRILIQPMRISRKIFVVVFVVFMSGLLVKSNPRFNSAISKVFSGELSINKNARYDFATRILSWDASLTLIKQSPLLGYGSGDTQDKLNAVYGDKGYKYPLELNLNAHNQFFQIWLENGLPGLIVFVFILVSLFLYGFKNNQEHKFLLLSLFSLLTINALFESYLNRYSGISFFAFFWCITLIGLPKENET